MKRKRPTPRARLVDLLCEHGFAVCEDDISWVKGAWAHDHFDVTHRWTATVVRVSDGKRVEITGRDSITKCARYGIELEEKPSDLYGDYGASAKSPNHNSPSLVAVRTPVPPYLGTQAQKWGRKSRDESQKRNLNSD